MRTGGRSEYDTRPGGDSAEGPSRPPALPCHGTGMMGEPWHPPHETVAQLGLNEACTGHRSPCLAIRAVSPSHRRIEANHAITATNPRATSISVVVNDWLELIQTNVSSVAFCSAALGVAVQTRLIPTFENRCLEPAALQIVRNGPAAADNSLRQRATRYVNKCADFRNPKAEVMCGKQGTGTGINHTGVRI
jgi:hypothetical protein